MKRIYRKCDGYKYKDLLKYGLDHLRSAGVLFKKDPICYDSAGYLVQLGLELILKSILLDRLDEFPAEHNLKILYNLVKKAGFIKLLKDEEHLLKKISEFYNLRYPNPKQLIEIGNDYWKMIEHIANSLLSYFPEQVFAELDYSASGHVIKGGRILIVKTKKGTGTIN
ncbi:MAG: HEPN domain-containing protein [Elusimicrobiota bacterium]